MVEIDAVDFHSHLEWAIKSARVRPFDIELLEGADFDYDGHCNELYPGWAMRLLQMEADRTYPGASPAGTIDMVLARWLRNNVPNPTDFVRRLMAAVQIRNCVPALLTRLNLACLTAPTSGSTTIINRGKTVRVVHPSPTLDYLPEAAHDIVRTACDRLRQPFLTKATAAARRMETVNAGLDLEQILLTRTAYLILHAQLRRARPTLPVLGITDSGQ